MNRRSSRADRTKTRPGKSKRLGRDDFIVSIGWSYDQSRSGRCSRH